MARGLLDRLAAPQQAKMRDTSAEGVMEHVQFLLNTRQGSSALDPSFGVPDFTDTLHDLPGGLSVLRAMIEDCIRRDEPRLTQIRVQALASEERELVLRFEVHAQLRSGAPIRFQTEVSRAGQVRVQG